MRYFLSVLYLVTTVSLWAQGTPPFYTDDASTVGKGQCEFDFGLSEERARNGDSSWQVPSIAISYGLTDSFAINYNLPWLIVRPVGESAKNGLGNSIAGVKWRFFEDGKSGLAASVTPQVEFNNPTSSRRRGLVENNTEFILPFQVQKSFGAIDAALNAGHTFHTRERGETDGWQAGVAVGRNLTERLHAGVELYGESTERFDRGLVILNAGAIYEVGGGLSIFVSFGRGIAGANRPDYVSLVGVRLIRCGSGAASSGR